MKYVLIALFVAFFVFEMSFPVNAVVTPPVDQVEYMMARVNKNIKVASQVTQIARKKSATLVAQKEQEKASLKNAIICERAKVEAIEQRTELLSAKMISAGLDTSLVSIDARMKGPAYEAYLNYVEEGGQEDFDYFRMYLWQQK
jgi:hypothetical protein